MYSAKCSDRIVEKLYTNGRLPSTQQAGRQAGRKAGTQAGRQAGRKYRKVF